jgi:hypothetical protein
MTGPDIFGRATVVTVLRREQATFAENARRCRDVQQTCRYERIVAAFDEAITALEQAPAVAPCFALAVAS